jgi:hypothetical protein
MRTAHMGTGTALVAVLLATGCDGDSRAITDPEELPPDIRIEAVTPTAITGTVGEEVTPVPALRATDLEGNPVPGIQMWFDLTPNAGAVGTKFVTTDSHGLVTMGFWRLGIRPGTHSVDVRHNRQVVARFTAQAAVGPVGKLAPFTGADQWGIVREKLPYALSVTVTDAFGNAVPNTTVTFDVVAGEGTIEGSTATTDSAGFAASGTWTLGPVPGVQQVAVRSGDVEVLFSAVACEDCRSLMFVREGRIYQTDQTGLPQIFLAFGYQPKWSADGQRIAFVNYSNWYYYGSDIFVMDADGANARMLLSGSDYGFSDLYSPSWSPDGTRLVVARGSSWDGDLLVANADGTGQASVLKAMAASPAWAPDGSKIAFASLSGGQANHALHLMNPDGSSVTELVPRDPGFINGIAWSPDSRQIAYMKCFVTQCDIYLIDADGSGARRLTTLGNASSPSWSPAGDSIALSLSNYSASMREAIAVIPASGGAPTFVTAGNSPAWRP